MQGGRAISNRTQAAVRTCSRPAVAAVAADVRQHKSLPHPQHAKGRPLADDVVFERLDVPNGAHQRRHAPIIQHHFIRSLLRGHRRHIAAAGTATAARRPLLLLALLLPLLALQGLRGQQRLERALGLLDLKGHALAAQLVCAMWWAASAERSISSEPWRRPSLLPPQTLDALQAASTHRR